MKNSLHRTICVTAILYSFALIIFGFILFSDEITRLPEKTILEKIFAGENPSSREIKDALDSYNKLLITIPSDLDNRSFLEIQTDKNILPIAREHTIKSLDMAPANPSLWLRLGLLDFILKHDDREVASAIIMSVKTGPYIPEIFIPRLKFALEHWEVFDNAEKYILQGQIRDGWRMDREKMQEIAKNPGLEKIIAETLGNDYKPL